MGDLTGTKNVRYHRIRLRQEVGYNRWSLTSRGRLKEVVAYDRSSLTTGRRLIEVVAYRGRRREVHVAYEGWSHKKGSTVVENVSIKIEFITVKASSLASLRHTKIPISLYCLLCVVCLVLFLQPALILILLFNQHLLRLFSLFKGFQSWLITCFRQCHAQKRCYQCVNSHDAKREERMDALL